MSVSLVSHTHAHTSICKCMCKDRRAMLRSSVGRSHILSVSDRDRFYFLLCLGFFFFFDFMNVIRAQFLEENNNRVRAHF